MGNVQTGFSFLVGRGTLALINAGLALGKNRSGLNRSRIPLLTGPVGTRLVLCDNLPAGPDRT